MEKIAVLYLEGSDSKITVFEKDNDKLKLIKAESLSASPAFIEKQEQKTTLESFDQVEMVNYEGISEETAISSSFVQSLKKVLEGEDLKLIKFIPVLTEPGVYYQRLEDENDLSVLKASFNGREKDHPVETIEIADKLKLAVYPSGKSNYMQALNLLAKMNALKYIKIESVKSADISLSNYVAEKEDLKETELSLILYIGKEYAKLTFMKGRKILHIGSTVNAGKNTINSYYVIISKILLEMENASIHSLNKIIICGEDSSDDLLQELDHSFPESELSYLKIAEFSVPGSNLFNYVISAYSVNIAVAEEYLKEQTKQTKGINLLPAYIADEQKSFGWQSYIIFLLIFMVVFGFTGLIMDNNTQLRNMGSEITRLQKVQAENQEMSDRLQSKKTKIANYNNSQTILQSYSKETGSLSAALRKIAGYASENDIWFTGVDLDAKKNLKVSGYALYRSLLTRLSYSYSEALLSEIVYEPLRDYKSYKFNLSTKLENAGVQNETKK